MKSLSNNSENELEYRVSKSQKVRITKVLICLIPVLLTFIFSSLSGLGLVAPDWEHVNTFWFFLLLGILIYVIIDNRQSRRIVINKEGIYHIRPKNRFFLSWNSILSVEYSYYFSRYGPEDTVNICVKDDNRRVKIRAGKGKVYGFNLVDYYPIFGDLTWDGRHIWWQKPNNNLNQCLDYYCKKHNIKYVFKIKYVKQSQHRIHL